MTSFSNPNNLNFYLHYAKSAKENSITAETIQNRGMKRKFQVNSENQEQITKQICLESSRKSNNVIQPSVAPRKKVTLLEILEQDDCLAFIAKIRAEEKEQEKYNKAKHICNPISINATLPVSLSTSAYSNATNISPQNANNNQGTLVNPNHYNYYTNFSLAKNEHLQTYYNQLSSNVQCLNYDWMVPYFQS